MGISSTDLALVTSRVGLARLGASRLGFIPEDTVPGTGEYIWDEIKPPTTQWTLVTEGGPCGRRPVAAFTDTPDPSYVDAEVTFTDASRPEADITYWHWDFGDGGESYEENPTHIYAESGTYTVTLSVASRNGSDTVSGEHVVVGTSNVRGIVQDDAIPPNPFPDALVFMRVDDVLWPGGPATTDENGFYLFSGVPAGAIQVDCNDSGYSGTSYGTTEPPADLVLDITMFGV